MTDLISDTVYFGCLSVSRSFSVVLYFSEKRIQTLSVEKAQVANILAATASLLELAIFIWQCPDAYINKQLPSCSKYPLSVIRVGPIAYFPL